ncbi:hypothetical protein MRB53_031950 [Persea americana]|uniref:Uncharacterized protein n=1 Tax=Persea americana TaxID=3435 RepID=A0ACC2KRE9_PERAE|nr:hypothetical protein MRB53_031950 [Persea americana]
MRSREALNHLFELCSNQSSIAQLHSLLLKSSHFYDCFFATKLTSAYAKSSCIESARQVFDETPQRTRTVFLWNAILRAYCREHQWHETLRLFGHMTSAAVEMPDNFTVPIALKACSGLSALGSGKAIHGFVKKLERIDLDAFVGAALVELYAKCGDMGDARKVFDEFPEPDVVLWTSVVTGYQQNGDGDSALSFFSRMLMVGGLDPDPVTLVSAVSASAQCGDLGSGRCCHGFVVRRGFEHDLSLANSLLNFYAKVGHMDNARNLFNRMPKKDVVSWSSMIAGYSQNGNAVEALGLFNEMIEKGIAPNSITVVSALQACAVACDLNEGRRIHKLAARKGFELDMAVSTALVDMYMKCSCFEDAMDLFCRMPKKDVVSWAALISGCAHNGFANESMGAFRSMLSDGMIPDAVTMVKVLAASSQLGVVKQALCLHGYLVTSGFNDQMFVGAALLDLYSKCGSLDNAIRVFDKMGEKDVVVWSSMIAGYGIHGHGGEAIQMFERMIESSFKPNHVTFVSILSACSHAGLIDEGINFFDRMVKFYGLLPNSEHYCIMVDLLGRKGQLAKAAELIQGMPILANPHVWGALLGACHIHGNVELGEFAAENLFKVDPSHGGYYVLLSNIYAVNGKWDKVAEVRSLMKERGVRCTAGCSSIEVGNIVNTFIADDRLHPESGRMYGLLRELEVKVREEGYIPVELKWKTE